MRALVLVLAVGCGSSVSDADRQACEKAGAATDRTLRKALVLDSKVVPEKLDAPNIYTEHCIADRWSPDMRDCLTYAESGAELVICERFLTPDQRTKLHDDADSQIRKQLLR